MSEDLIKRSDAIKALNREKSDWNCDYNVPIDNCIKRLNKVKSADRPQGVWLETTDGEHFCSACHKDAIYNAAFEEILSDFCPRCGCRMKGADDE